MHIVNCAVTDLNRSVYRTAVAGTQCGEPCARRWRCFFFSRVLHNENPNQTTMVILRRRRHERGL